MESAADRRLFWGTASAIVAADIVSKVVAESVLSRRLRISVIGDFSSCAWSTTSAPRSGCAWARTPAGFSSPWRSALFVLGSMVRSAPKGDRVRLFALALVCAGAVGNVIDRLRSRLGVVDFVDVGIGLRRWPTFNVADSAITVGAIALAVSLWLEGRAQDRAKEARAAEP
jgi:signal peptidase II